MPEKLLDLMAAAGLADVEGATAQESPQSSDSHSTYELLSWEAISNGRTQQGISPAPDNSAC
jgi:hypothetical protein